VLVCKGACDFDAPTNVAVKGLLVLAPERFSSVALNMFILMNFDHVYEFNQEPNGCFVLDTVNARQTYAGIYERGVTSWSLHGGRLYFSLFKSDDAGHVVNAQLTSNGFEGMGSSWGVGSANPDSGPDVVKARRVGVPTYEECVRAGAELRDKKRGAV
jgi:hypothetical protein